MALYKYQMSSWPVTFYPMPLIWTATTYINIGFSDITGLFDGVFIRLFLVTWPKWLQPKQNMFYYKL